MHFNLDKKDGTPFNVTSILEEDIVKICIQLGHIHPMGILCYSVTKSIILFQSADKTQHITCGAIKVMVLCEKTIAIRASPPSMTHMRAYMAVVSGEPSRTWPPPSEGEEELHLPTGNPLPPEGMPQHLQVNLGDLADSELCQLMEDLCWEVILHELNAPPEALHQYLGEAQ